MAGVAGSNPVAPTLSNKVSKFMDSTFIPITITFLSFMIIAFYLNVIRSSAPLVMIYFIYCFSYFLNKDKITASDEQIFKKVDAQTKNAKKLKIASKDTLNALIGSNNHLLNPKPIVSSSPKPIFIDSTTEKKSNNNKVESTEILASSVVFNKEDDNNLKNPLKLNEMMICRGIYKRNPIKPGIKFLNNVDSLFCYTKISNIGNKQEVKHIWYFENKEMTTVSYNIKTSYNYRSWSKKTIYPNQTGKWRVDVVNNLGDILGSRDFSINSINTNY